MLGQPVSDRDRGADESPDQDAFAASNQSSHQHAAAGAHADLSPIFAVNAAAFELAFVIDVGPFAHAGVHQSSVQDVTVAVRHDHAFGQQNDGRLARDTPGAGGAGDAAFDGCADWRYLFAVK